MTFFYPYILYFFSGFLLIPFFIFHFDFTPPRNLNGQQYFAISVSKPCFIISCRKKIPGRNNDIEIGEKQQGNYSSLQFPVGCKDGVKIK
jgi:hypothetical protein